MTNYRWVICVLLFFATTINYMDRQVLSLTFPDFISPEFHWSNKDYGFVTGCFSLFYAIAMLFAGRIVDWLDTKKGFIVAVTVWSIGAILHAFCGIATAGTLSGSFGISFEEARNIIATSADVEKVIAVSMALFLGARLILAVGEAGSFPACVKATAEYFPKKDRAYATSWFNSGSTIGALIAPLTIPFIAKAYGWEMAFIIIGALGFVWIGFWQFLYKKPDKNNAVNAAELKYINQDDEDHLTLPATESKAKVSLWKAFRHRQTWAFASGKFMTDGVWWFFLFWIPSYMKQVFHMDTTQSAPYIFVIYLITMLSVFGGYLPTIFIEKKKMNPYAGRMRAMLIFAFIPLLVLFAQPLGSYSPWIPIIIIGLACTAHQSWSANIFTTVSDMFPKYAVATVTGIGGMAGGLGSFFIQQGSGAFFDYAAENNLHFAGFSGIQAGYFVVFIFCAVAYLIGWCIIKTLVPHFKIIREL
ncbi:MAG: MFS transporter [Bacteroidaceae bacterium]|nr:MFS transporter [Bacteroidaceae bacterium]